jgi:hypothetical protein
VTDVQIGDWVKAETQDGKTIESQVSFVIELEDEDDIIVLDYDHVRASDIIELDKGGRDAL